MAVFTQHPHDPSFANVLIDVNHTPASASYSLKVHLWTDTVFSAWAQEILEDPDNSSQTELDLANNYTDYTLAVVLQISAWAG